ncbi:acyl carrier protein [Micromonospora rifamycinica]|uniref:acyl carrier protein n=1 Tax=Micromonospora rifamycinica TaxID=291594 RepID=UPI003423363E
MNNIEEFADVLRDELGLSITDADLERHLDEVAGWDSVHLLSLLTILERRTMRQIPMVEILEAPTLRDIYLAATR